MSVALCSTGFKPLFKILVLIPGLLLLFSGVLFSGVLAAKMNFGVPRCTEDNGQLSMVNGQLSMVNDRGSMDIGFRTLDIRHSTLDIGNSTLGIRHSILDIRHSILDLGLWTSNVTHPEMTPMPFFIKNTERLLIQYIIKNLDMFPSPDCILRGKIIDSMSLQPLRHVLVMIAGTPLGAATDSCGEYIIRHIPPGYYDIRTSLLGYKTSLRKAVHLSVGMNRADFVMSEFPRVLSDIVVRPGRSKNEVNEFVGSSRLNNEELKRMPGNLDDVVRSVSVFPGIAQISNYYNDLIVGGGGPAENLYIIDGLEVPNINHYGSQANAGGVLSFINIDYVNSVNFYSGGFSAAYGNKISSVMDIRMQNGSRDRFHAKAVLSATQFAFNADGPLSENTSLILSARQSYLDMVFKYSGFSFAPRFYDIFARISSKPDKNNYLSFLFTGVKDKIILFNPDEENDNGYNRALFNDQTQLISGVSYLHTYHNASLEMNMGCSYRYYESLPSVYFNNNSSQLENTARLKLSFNLSPESVLNIGVQNKWINYVTDMRIHNFVSSFHEVIRMDSLQKDVNYSATGAYIQFDHNFSDRLKLGLGVRGDFFNATDETYTISPRLQAKYFFACNSSLALSLGLYRQAPEYLWIISNPQNRSLKSITCRQIHLEFEQKFGEAAGIKLRGFLKKYSDYPASILRRYLVMTNAGQGFSGVDDNFSGYGLDRMTSAGEGLAKGVELYVEKKRNDDLNRTDDMNRSDDMNHTDNKNHTDDPFRASLSLTYSKAQFRALDGILRPGSFDQRWNLTFIAGFDLGKNMEITARFRYASGTPYTPFDSQGIQHSENYNTARIEDLHSLDLRIDKIWEMKILKLRTYIDIQNIYNHKVRTLIRWLREQKKIAEDPILGIVPTIGINIEL